MVRPCDPAVGIVHGAYYDLRPRRAGRPGYGRPVYGYGRGGYGYGAQEPQRKTYPGPGPEVGSEAPEVRGFGARGEPMPAGSGPLRKLRFRQGSCAANAP